MQIELNKIAKDTNLFLKKFIKKQKKTELIIPMQYGLFSRGKKIRSKILIDVGSLFKINYKLTKLYRFRFTLILIFCLNNLLQKLHFCTYYVRVLL